MQKPTLVIMAAGMGSRYGGLKQIDPVGPNGEIIIDYSIYDAISAGFSKIVFIIKEEIEKDFKEIIGNRIEKMVQVEYAYQKLSNLPQGFSVPEGRTKPWGTGHAVLSCKGIINEPFAVINADDYYGKEAFGLLYSELININDDNQYNFCMVGYQLENTITENGHVARGVCKVNENGYLTDIVERTRIKKRENKIQFTEDGENWVNLSVNSIVSMNCWGFTLNIIDELNNRFSIFLENNMNNILKAEYFLPFVVDGLIKENKAKVKVLKTEEKWYGVTYKGDKETVVSAIGQMIKDGKYPKRLWGNE
jgi:UTP-glucose-1-phosphate uridylyltransferase